MGKKSRQKHAHGRHERSAAVPIHSRTPATVARFKYPWLARLVAAVVVPVLLLGLIEFGLRICGYGYSTRFFVPAGDGETITTNPKFAWQYYSKKTANSPIPLLFPKKKAPGTFRIFILGESAAAGTPDPAFGFWRMLDLMLRKQYPSNRFEVLNAAMRGIDSHIIRQIARECADLSPDLFIVYAGNNDMIGLHAPSPEESTLTSNIHWLRFKHALARLRFMQLGSSWFAHLGKKEGPKQDMEFFRRQRLAFDDSRRDSVYRNYEINLRDICRYAKNAGAQTLLCSLAVNLHDFPPLASLHKNGLSAEQLAQWEKYYAEGSAAELTGNHAGALASFERAASLDDHFAELLFRVARCYEALGKIDDPRRYYSLARDWDALQFRTDGRLNSIIRSLGTNSSPRIHFVDLEQALSRSPLADAGIPGRRIFQEHVHFTFDGDHQVATLLLPPLAEVLKLPPPSKAFLSRSECARSLAYTDIDDINVRTSINRLTSNPPFLDQLEHAVRQLKAEHKLQERVKTVTERDTEAAFAIYRAAIAARPDDWMLKFNYANLLSQLNQPAAAVPYFEQVAKRLPVQPKFRVALGNALVQAGKAQEAKEHFEAALRIDPDLPAAKDGLKIANARR